MTRVLPRAAASLAQKVYWELLQAINDGRCRPGDRITEPDVAQWLQVSRTPVREALRRLESEDVLSRGTQGLVVTQIGEDEVLELYELRETLEIAAARLAARNATADDRRRLSRLLTEEANCSDHDSAALAAINRRFHGAIGEATHNRFLCKTLNAVQDGFLRLRSSTLSVPGRPGLVLEEHRAMADAIARGDVAAAARAARRHIRESRRYRLRLNEQIQAATNRPGRSMPLSRSGASDPRRIGAIVS